MIELLYFLEQARANLLGYTSFLSNHGSKRLEVGSILCHHHLINTSLNLPLTISLIERSQVLVWDVDSQWQVEAGAYKVMVAKNAADLKPLTTVITEEAGVTEKVRPCLLKEVK